MKQFPSRLNYKKNHRLQKQFLQSIDNKNFIPLYGKYAIKSLRPGKIRYKQIEACRRTIRRGLGKGKGKAEKLKIRLFTHVPVTKKSLLSRMGKGKGKIDKAFYFAPITRGQILFEVIEKDSIKLSRILSKGSMTLPVKTNIIRLKY